MMRRILLGLWILGVSASHASAEPDTLGVLSGTVTSAEDGLALRDASGRVTLQPLTRVRLSVATPDSIRVLAGAALTAEQRNRDQFIGTLQGRRDDDVLLSIRSPESELAIPIRSVTLLESSLGRRGNAGRGATIGIGAGMVGGVVAALIVCSGGDCESSGFFGTSTGVMATLLGAGGAIAGCGVGAITGALIRTEHWRAVPIQDLPYGEGSPMENSIRVGLTLPIWSRDLVAGMEGF